MNLLHCKIYPGADKQQVPLVLLHGFLGSYLDWNTVVKDLSNSIPCIAIDLPGHGGSASIVVDSKQGFAQCSRMLKDTLLANGIPRYALLGYSLGGRIAMHHAMHYPDQIAALIVESGHPGLTSAEEKQLRLAHDQRWAERIQSEPFRDVLASWYRQAVFTELSAQQRRVLIEKRLENSPVTLAKMLLAFSLARQPNLRSLLANADFPRFYLYGEKDTKYSQLAQKLAARYTSLKLISFNDAGHNVHFEQPVDFVKKVQDICIGLR